jgi:uncharacterized Zn finger protein
MSKFNKIKCPKCGTYQLQPEEDKLITTIHCVNCGHVNKLINILGPK